MRELHWLLSILLIGFIGCSNGDDDDSSEGASDDDATSDDDDDDDDDATPVVHDMGDGVAMAVDHRDVTHLLFRQNSNTLRYAYLGEDGWTMRKVYEDYDEYANYLADGWKLEVDDEATAYQLYAIQNHVHYAGVYLYLRYHTADDYNTELDFSYDPTLETADEVAYDLAVLQPGHPLVAATGAYGAGPVRLYWWTDGVESWEDPPIDLGDSTQIDHLALELLADGSVVLAISARNGWGDDPLIIVTTNTSGEWEQWSEPIAEVADALDLALGPDGQAYVFWYGRSDGALRLTTDTSGTVETTNFESFHANGPISTDVHDAGAIHAATLLAGATDNILHLTDASGTWETSTPGLEGERAGWVSLDARGQGEVHMAFYEPDDEELRLMSNVSGDWVVEAVDPFE